MQENKVTIKDIAEELGLSTATVSNVIHGKTKKISDRTVEKVQEKLEESGYIPNMAAVLLAQNTSRIVCIVLSDDVRYEKKMLEDPFVSGMLNGLSKELTAKGYFMMLKEEPDVEQIVRYASMWNMAGLILIGYCDMDYEKLRNRMHIPFVVVDAYTSSVHNYSDVGIDNIRGGYLAGQYLIAQGHQRIMYLSDNDEGCDHDRYEGLKQAQKEAGIACLPKDFRWLHPSRHRRMEIYETLYEKRNEYTAAFVASDVFAIEFMNFLQDKGVSIPEEFSVMGFDNIPLADCIRPGLTTIAQDLGQRAQAAVELLQELIDGKTQGRQELLPVELIIRGSVGNIQEKKEKSHVSARRK